MVFKKSNMSSSLRTGALGPGGTGIRLRHELVELVDEDFRERLQICDIFVVVELRERGLESDLANAEFPGARTCLRRKALRNEHREAATVGELLELCDDLETAFETVTARARHCNIRYQDGGDFRIDEGFELLEAFGGGTCWDNTTTGPFELRTDDVEHFRLVVDEEHGDIRTLDALRHLRGVVLAIDMLRDLFGRFEQRRAVLGVRYRALARARA